MAHITSSPAVTCHSPPFSPLIDQFCGNQALWLVKAAMIPVLWLAVTRTDCYLVTGSPGQTRCHGRATREQQLGENIFLSKPLWCILQNASKWILFFSKIILNVNLSFKFIIERATPGKYLVNQNSMSCSKCLFCNLKARSIRSVTQGYQGPLHHRAGLSEKKGKLHYDWGWARSRDVILPIILPLIWCLISCPMVHSQQQAPESQRAGDRQCLEPNGCY